MHGGSWLHIFGDSLGLTVVFKCSRETGSAWGIMATYFGGLLGVDGCIQMFGGVRTGLQLCVFPLLIMMLLSIYIYNWIGNKFLQLTSPSPYKYINSINKTNQMTANSSNLLYINRH